MWAERLLAALLAISLAAPASAAPGFGLGRLASPAEIAGWDVDVSPDGSGLPEGRGDVASGETLYAERCAACHGDKGAGGAADRLVGGRGTLATAKPVKTVGSFWPYATTVFDYIRRAMPYTAPGSLSSEEVYSLTAYLLWLNDVVPRSAVLDRRSLPMVQMPNHGGFLTNPVKEAPTRE